VQGCHCNLLVYTSYPEIFHPFWGTVFGQRKKALGCDLLILSCLDVIRSVNEEIAACLFIFEGCYAVLFALMITGYIG
jgi:hypothetical protein